MLRYDDDKNCLTPRVGNLRSKLAKLPICLQIK